MADLNWMAEFPGSILVCDLHGVVLEINDKAAEMYRSYGGKDLIGRSLIECHPEPARSKLLRLLETGESNFYTTERNGIKKFIFQSPWYQNGIRGGMVELAFEVPLDIPHFIRK